MKISLNVCSYNHFAKQTAFCSVNKNHKSEHKSEKPNTHVPPSLIKAYMFPKAVFNGDIKSKYLSAQRRSNEVIDRFCEIKSKSYKIQEESKELLDKADRLYKLIENGNWEQMPFFEDEKGNIGYVEQSGDTVSVRFNANFIGDIVQSDEIYSFNNKELTSYSQDIKNYSNGDISCKSSTVFENGRLAVQLYNLNTYAGCQDIGEEFNFDEDGYISRYNKNYSKSANGIITYDEIFTMWGLGTLESYIKNFRLPRNSEPKALEQMDFSGASLTRYIKNDPFSDNDMTLEFDKGWLTKIIKNGITTPPDRSYYED